MVYDASPGADAVESKLLRQRHTLTAAPWMVLSPHASQNAGPAAPAALTSFTRAVQKGLMMPMMTLTIDTSTSRCWRLRAWHARGPDREGTAHDSPMQRRKPWRSPAGTDPGPRRPWTPGRRQRRRARRRAPGPAGRGSSAPTAGSPASATAPAESDKVRIKSGCQSQSRVCRVRVIPSACIIMWRSNLQAIATHEEHRPRPPARASCAEGPWWDHAGSMATMCSACHDTGTHCVAFLQRFDQSLPQPR